MSTKEESMGKATPADIIFRRAADGYRAVPPVYRAHPPSRDAVLIRNLTGHRVTVWSPQGVLDGTPRSIDPRAEESFQINTAVDVGAFVYAAYVADEEEFVEGNSPPVIIIDK